MGGRTLNSISWSWHQMSGLVETGQSSLRCLRDWASASYASSSQGRRVWLVWLSELCHLRLALIGRPTPHDDSAANGELRMIATSGIDREVVRREAPAPAARRRHMAAIWTGVGAGKAHHHRVAIDESGHRLHSRRAAKTNPSYSNSLPPYRPWTTKRPGASTWPTTEPPRQPSRSRATTVNPCGTSPAGPFTAPLRATAAREAPASPPPQPGAYAQQDRRRKRLEAWLRNPKVHRSDQLAEAALQAAESQHPSPAASPYTNCPPPCFRHPGGEPGDGARFAPFRF